MKNYTAKTIEELLEIASEDLGCSISEIQYNITEEKKGVLGLGNSVSADVFTMDDIKEFLFDYLGNFFIVNLNAENNAILIGKMGKTLAAFNTVVRGAVNAEFKKRIDVLIDINHYKEERYDKLRSMGKRIAKQVQRSHVDAELDPMPNDERKVIHKALNDWHNIKTESKGEGSARHICICYVPDAPVSEEVE